MLSSASSSQYNTNLLIGSFSQSDNNGSITIKGHGDTADIIFYNRNNYHETRASIKLFTLEKIKKNVFFYHCVEGQEEVLLHAWGTKIINQGIVKYSEQCPIAFVFSSEGNVMDGFKKISSVPEFLLLDYFKEVQFCEQLQKKAGITIKELRNIAGFNDERIKLLYDYSHNFAALLKCGVTIRQLAALNDAVFNLLITNDKAVKTIFKLGLTLEQLEFVSLANLMKCIENNHELQEALKLVTIEQILAIDHVPKKLNVNISKQNKLNLTSSSGFSGGSSGHYSYESDEKTLVVTDSRNKSTFKVFCGVPDIEMLSNFNAANTEMLTLLHDWYLIANALKESGDAHRIWYCPALNSIHQEVIDADFSEEEFRDHAQYMLLHTAYYKERDFVKFLNALGYSIVEIKNLPDMSLQKLELCYQDSYSLKRFLEAGISIADLSKVDINRLQYLFNNLSAVNAALKFVDAKELLGLHQGEKINAHGFFAQKTMAQPDTQEEDNNNWNCLLM